MEFTVFYAWQMDHPRKGHRDLIRDAAEDALLTLGKNASIESSPREEQEDLPSIETPFVGALDHDVKGLSGTPDIVGSIYRKIEKCGVFLADLSFVARTFKGKMIPNPNVLLELGYAARCIGWDRVICVVNEAHGSPNESMFDIRNHRWPIVYRLETPSNEEVGRVRKQLSSKIREAILAVLNSEYSAVEDTLAILSSDAINIIEYFYDKQLCTDGKIVLNTAFAFASASNAINRLLELRIIRLIYDPDIDKTVGKSEWADNRKSYYKFTYLGDMVLNKLGIKSQTS